LSLVLKDAPAGEWIALSFDQTRMMGHGETVDEAVKAAKLAGEGQAGLVENASAERRYRRADFPTLRELCVIHIPG